MYTTYIKNIPIKVILDKTIKGTDRIKFYRRTFKKNGKIDCNMCGEKAVELRFEAQEKKKKGQIEEEHYNLYTKKGDMFSFKRDLNKCFCGSCFYRMTRRK